LLTVEVDAFAALRLPNCFDALFDFSCPLVKLLLSNLFSEPRRRGELRFMVRTVQPPVLFAHVIREPLARAVISPAVLT